MEQLSTRIVYQNPWTTVREDEVRWPDGATGRYGYVVRPDFALVMPRGDGGWWMVEQYRYAIGRRSLEFPQGGWPAGRTGSALELARLELGEETGLTAEKFERIGYLHAAGGLLTQGFDAFVATGLTEGEPDREHTEQDMEHRFVPDAELVKLITSGEIVDAATVAALQLYALTRSGAA